MRENEFLWGAATSAHQIEGGNVASDWWEWEQKGFVEGGALSGQATDHWRRAREDLALARSLGLNSYRFSVEWAKLEPQPGAWNEEAFVWYDQLLDHCEALELKPMLTLHHFTLPNWVAERGGFSAPETVDHFLAFCRKVVERYGPRVPLWCTLNEPMVLGLGSYLGKFMPPAETSPALLALACANMLEAHAQAYDLIHARVTQRSGPWATEKLQVGIAHNMLDFLPDRWWHPLERILAGVVHRYYNLSWLNAITGRRQHFGIPFLLACPPQLKHLRGRCTADFIGVNFYTKAFIRWRPRDSSEGATSAAPVGLAFSRRLEEQSDMGWALHPAGFRRLLRVAASYGLPLYVTENGLADRDDRLRPRYLRDHLREIARLVREGVDIRGYYYWSLLDNFEWIKGFGPRFGLFHVDYATFRRTPRPSAQLYQKIIAAHAGHKSPCEDILSTVG